MPTPTQPIATGLPGTDLEHSGSEIIPLAALHPFGVGGRRLCFVHPHDPEKCVKVLRSDDRRTVRIKKKSITPNWLRREYNNNTHEQEMLERLSRRLGPVMSQHLPICYGMFKTDLGLGLVLDLVRDHDGQISRSLRELISSGIPIHSFKAAWNEFSSFLLEHRVLTRNLLDHNLVAQRQAEGSWKLFLIDGFGDPAWLPFARWIKPLQLMKIKKRLATAWPRMEAFESKGGVSDELIANSTWDQGFLRHRGERLSPNG